MLLEALDDPVPVLELDVRQALALALEEHIVLAEVRGGRGDRSGVVVVGVGRGDGFDVILPALDRRDGAQRPIEPVRRPVEDGGGLDNRAKRERAVGGGGKRRGGLEEPGARDAARGDLVGKGVERGEHHRNRTDPTPGRHLRRGPAVIAGAGRADDAVGPLLGLDPADHFLVVVELERVRVDWPGAGAGPGAADVDHNHGVPGLDQLGRERRRVRRRRGALAVLVHEYPELVERPVDPHVAVIPRELDDGGVGLVLGLPVLARKVDIGGEPGSVGHVEVPAVPILFRACTIRMQAPVSTGSANALRRECCAARAG